MDPKTKYISRLKSYKEHLKWLLKKQSQLSILRLTAGFLLIGGLYFYWGSSIVLIIFLILLLVSIYGWLLIEDSDNKTKINHQEFLIKIVDNELASLSGNHEQFESGSRFIQKDHSYTSDLDIFGHASVFQMLNRTSSVHGSEMLANWLSAPAEVQDILLRQSAIKELMDRPEWMEEIRATGMENPLDQSGRIKLREWLAEKKSPITNRQVLFLKFIYPSIMFLITLFFIAGLLSWKVLAIALILFGFISENTRKKLNPVFDLLDGLSPLMQALAKVLQKTESEIFRSPLLLSITESCRSYGQSGSKEIKKFSFILERHDLRRNKMLAPILEIYFSWSVRQFIQLERWKSLNKEKVEVWFDSLAQLETLISFATVAQNHPDWSFPTFTQDSLIIQGVELGHPLIENVKSVPNDVEALEKGNIMLVTGSNMAGKSTYLRTIGVNVVMSMAGSPICGRSLKISPSNLITSMRVTDNLEESTSTFYAELKKLKKIIEKVNNNEPVFILLDEILRGTNSKDRHTGSVGLLNQFIRKNATGIIATHDLELADLKQTYPKNIFNYHFDVTVSNSELSFDYKLKPGICTSMNASILMQKIGIELP